jgi:ADP-ribosylglycohydrolase
LFNFVGGSSAVGISEPGKGVVCDKRRGIAYKVLYVCGDADTMGAITGAIAEAFYGGVPQYIKEEVINRLPNEFIEVMHKFYLKFVEK